MSVCVNTKSKEFKDAVDRLNISQGSLENIVHEYINAEGNVDSFPSDSYILSKIEGEPFTEELSEKAQKLIELKYSKPIVVNSYADAQAVMRDISQYFDSRHIGLKETKDGKFEVSLAKASNNKEGYSKKSAIERSNSDRMQRITDLEGTINDLEVRKEQINKQKFINDSIKEYNKRFDEALTTIKRAGKTTLDGLIDFVNYFNSTYSDLIELGIIDKLSTEDAQKLSYFESDGRVMYNATRFRIKRNPANLRKAASTSLANYIKGINNQIQSTQQELKNLENTPFGDYINSLLSTKYSAVTRIVPNKIILSGYEEHQFNEYLKASRGVYPKEFITSLHGQRVTLQKINDNKNSRKYKVIGEDGGVIAEKLVLYTEEEYRKLKDRIKDTTNKFRPYNEGKSLRFKAFLETPSKGLFKYAAKVWLTEALETGGIKINYKAIDDFVNKFSDSFWQNVSTYLLNPQYGRNANIFGEMTTKSLEEEGWVFNPTIPKQGLIEELERIYNIKIDGKKVFGQEINRALKYNELENALVNFLNSKNFTQEEKLQAYANVHNLSIDEVNSVVNDLRKRAQEEGDVESSQKLHEILDYSPVKATIAKIKAEYNAKLAEYLESKGISIPKNIVNIVFNREIFSGEDTRINRLATIFHEPFHALEILAGNTAEMSKVQEAYNKFINTEYGKALLDGISEFNTVYESKDIQSEVLANLFSLLMMPKEYREAFLNQRGGTELLGRYLGNTINEFLSRPEVEKFLEAKTETEEHEILKTVTVEEREALPILKQMWNNFISMLEKWFNFVSEGLKFTERIHYIDKTISETVVTTKTSHEEVERLNESLLEFKEALSDLENSLREISGVEITEETKLRDNKSAMSAENGLSVPQEQVRPELSQFQNETTKVVTQLNNLLNSDLISNSEVRHIAEQTVYFISDTITEFLENPETLFNIFPELAVRDGKSMTDKERAEEIKKIQQMSRVELVKYITPQRLMEFTKSRLFTPQGNNNLNTRQLIKKARLIEDNFDAIIKFASDTFSIVEDFAITTADNEFTVNENLSPLNDDFNNTYDADTILENEGNLQEHWQIESRTLDVLSSMSQLVRAALNKCYLFRANPETGKLEKVPSEFGIAERVNVKDATSSILRWVQGAESLSHMVQLLEAKAKDNPWVTQIIDRLKDTSGKESDFQSQFYGVFAKAFQPYSIVLRERDEKTGQFVYKSISVNQHPALRDATQAIKVAYKTNMHPLFDGGKVKTDALEALRGVVDTLVERAQNKLEENDRAEIIDLIFKAATALGHDTDVNLINLALDSTSTFQSMVNNLKSIVDNLSKSTTIENYDPFKFEDKNNISRFLNKFLKPLTDKLEDTAVSSFYDSGKMYQSYVTPSYLTVMMNHFHGENATFQEWLQNEYGAYEWFVNPDGSWRNVWLETLDGMSQEDRKDLFRHKVQLNFNKHNYMKNMSDVEYALSILSEYFSEFAKAKGVTVPVWYRVPMMSNKPSSEFIRMNAYTGKPMKTRLIEGFSRIFQQELGRIQTVDIRGYDKSNPNFIKNFDKNGKKFMMLSFFNKYLEGGKEANSELGKLINKSIKEGTGKLTLDEQARMSELVDEEILTSMDRIADNIIAEWKSQGIFEGAKQIANIGKEDDVVEEKLREFIWNDTFASMNILELTITDPAYYKDAEDLQKRLAQIHAPGTRANIEALDYEGKRVTDGKFRTVLLKDFDDFVSNIKDNLRIVFDRKLKELENEGVSKEDSRYKAAAATYENIINQFDNINVADAQGYSSPTSYRKKAFIFGKWSRKSEDIYQKLRAGNYNYSDLQTAFQPLKPFVYGQIEKPAMDRGRRDIATPLSKLKVPVQFKNSEYLLIMADAILQNENTGKPNLLRAIYEVMEESADGDNATRGIDTIQFESTCKSGLMAPIDIKQYYNKEGGEAMAKIALREAIYNEDGSYNTDTYVYEVPFENYAIQQEVPEHFKNHFQAHGSQIRYIIPSDLESVDSEGNTVTYDYFDRGERKQLTAEEYKQEYERNISENIEASLEELSKQLGIGNEFLSRKDRNIALSQILIKEIYDSPRYGVELLTACAVNEETGEFNIPLGDPIQSKRIEQLINSIIKNRINKQEIAGGPVVQVTNFGTSKELNIRFNSKNGGLLMTKAEFAKTAPQNGKSYDIDAAYRKYIEENQAGIAYFEVFAPIYANELFEKFADRKGNIDIETIEMINPDLLKMIGYRIPTEDKYSMAPLKIVGFLPREAGDGIMLPNDITLLTGSDFDVDKFYLMRKEIGIAMRMNQPESVTLDNFNTEALEFTKNHREKVRNYLRTQIPNRENIKLTEKEENDIRTKINNDIDYEITQENKRHEAALKQIEEDAEDALIAYDERVEAGETVEGQEEKAESKVEKGKQRQINRENKYHERQLAKYEVKRERRIDNTLERERNRKVNQVVEDFLNGDIFSKSGDEVFKALKKAYINYMFDYVEDTEGTTYRNNKIIDMSWAVLTHETTASKMLTPGGFEPQKRMGYLVSAYQNPAVDKTWEELNAITDIDELKTLCYTDKNLCFIDTHLNFYKQNSAAATALGMAAVQKIAHAVLESNGFRIDVNNALHLEDDEFFSIAGKDFGGVMEIDNKYNDEGALIGRTLGEFVAMFADAVKDPVANLMNINNTTMPIVTALIRFGMPFEKVALFISQPIIRRVLETYNSENVTNFVRLSDVINRQLKSIEKAFDIENNSVLTELNTVTEEELINSLRSQEVETVTNYKILKFFQYLDTLAQQLKSPTYATRFNSISNAVGPLIIDNLIMEHKAENGNFDNFYDADGNKADINTILGMHPILGSFYKAVNIARSLFYDMPTNSQNFRNMLASADADVQSILYGDRKTLSSLSDFYQSYLLIASGAIPLEATAENHHQGLKYYIDKFPSDFMKANAKTLFKGNPLIDAIKLDIQNDKAVLKIDTTGMSTQDKEKLGDGWADLYKSGERGKKLAEHLFYYNFWRTGIGFSPKSFMGLFPTRLKNQIKGYNETFIVGSQNFARNVVGEVVLDQFIRNNADNNKLVPKIKIGKDDVLFEKKDNNYIFSGTNYEAIKNKPYLKFKQGNRDVLLKRVGDNNITNVATYIELSILGNNGEYFEASTDRAYTPITNTAEVKEQNNEGQIEETTNNEAQVNDVSTDIKPSIDTQSRRATKIRNKLVELFMMSGRTREAAEAKVAEFKAKSDMEKRAIKPQMKKFIENNLKKQGIEPNESLVEEMYNNLC